MSNKHENLSSLFINIADAIREKTGSTATIIADDFPDAIRAIDTSEDLMEEITAQENVIAAQDALITNITSALEGKATGGSDSEISMITTTIGEDIFYENELTIPELIGAKYFIIQGNPLTASDIANTNYTDDASTIRSIIYLNGIAICSYLARGSVNVNFCHTTTEICTDPSKFSFDETTGSVISNLLFFNKISSDLSTTGITYTVYRLG